MPRIKKSDVIAGSLAGVAIAILANVILVSLAVQLGVFRWAMVILLPVMILGGLWLASAASKLWGAAWQFAKFLVVGALNTFVDLGVLNLLMFATNISVGIFFTVFKAGGFVAAVINSYVWNKLWTFESRGTEKAGQEFSKFIAISTVGLALNTGIASILVNVIGAPGGVGDKVWGNIAAILAGIAVFSWNFLGYKLIVFRPAKKPVEPLTPDDKYGILPP